MKNHAQMLDTLSTAHKAMGGCDLCVCMGAEGGSARENAGSALLLCTGMPKKE